MLSPVKLVADPYPPYQFERDGKVTGMDYDLIYESFKIHDVGIQVSLHGWDECIALLDAGKADGIFQITRNAEREKRFLFSKVLRTARTLFFTKETESIMLHDGKKLSDRLGSEKIGILKGYSYSDEVDALECSLKVEKTANEELLDGLTRCEFSLALIDEGVAAFLIKGPEQEGIKPLPGFEISRPLFVAFRKDMREYVKLFNSGLSEIRINGVYESVLERYSL